MTIFLIVLLTALVFEYINGFHDAANAIATVVSTKVLTPRQAIALAVVFNLIGALMGTAVASTIGKGLVDANVVTMITIFSGLMGAITWNLVTWWFGLPSSSSHALIGGLCGATLATAAGNWRVIKGAVTDPVTHKHMGLLYKGVLPMFVSPVCGCVGGFVGLICGGAVDKNPEEGEYQPPVGLQDNTICLDTSHQHSSAGEQSVLPMMEIATPRFA